MGTVVHPILPKEVTCPVEIGSLGAIFETSPTEESLGGKEIRLLKGLVQQLEVYCLAVASAPSLAKFKTVRDALWPNYIRGLRALQETVLNVLAEPGLDNSMRMALHSLEQDIQKSGETYFGNAVTQQAEFTLWTIGKIRVLGQRLAKAAVPSDQRAEDFRLFGEYYAASLWAQFHLDCLMVAIRFKKKIAEEIRDEIVEGLRSAVNAYAIMKDSEALRFERVERGPEGQLPWDDEDERLLASSMRDANADHSTGD